MNKAFENWTWYNKPDIRSPLAAVYLNRINNGLNTVDDRVILLDSGKSDKSDLLLDIVDVAYNGTTGVWTYTRRNGSTFTFDQNIEKIPVSFSMDANGLITMTTADGTTYTADIASMIKIYTFMDSSIIDFTTTTDASGNKTITATVKDGSITAGKLEPNYLAQITVQAQNAAASADSASGSANSAAYDAQLSRSYAIGGSGIREGEDTDCSKYYKEQCDVALEDCETLEQSVQDAKDDVQDLYDDLMSDNLPEVQYDESTGHLLWRGSKFEFMVEQTTAHLMWRVA